MPEQKKFDPDRYDILHLGMSCVAVCGIRMHVWRAPSNQSQNGIKIKLPVVAHPQMQGRKPDSGNVQRGQLPTYPGGVSALRARDD